MPTPAGNAVEIAQSLIRCPSITPDDGGALDVLAARLTAAGFVCDRLTFSEDGTPDIITAPGAGSPRAARANPRRRD